MEQNAPVIKRPMGNTASPEFEKLGNYIGKPHNNRYFRMVGGQIQLIGRITRGDEDVDTQWGEGVATTLRQTDLHGLVLHPEQKKYNYTNELAGRDLSKIRMSGGVLENMNLTGTKFAEAVLENATLVNCYGTETDFSKLKGRGIRLINCHFVRPDLSGTDWSASRIVDSIIDDPLTKETCQLVQARVFNSAIRLRNSRIGKDARGSFNMRGMFAALSVFSSLDGKPDFMRLAMPDTAMAGCALYGFIMTMSDKRVTRPDFSPLSPEDPRLAPDEREFARAVGQWIVREDGESTFHARPDISQTLQEGRIYTVFSDMGVEAPNNSDTTDNVLVTAQGGMIVRKSYHDCALAEVGDFFPADFTQAGQVLRAQRQEAARRVAEEKAEQARIKAEQEAEQARKEAEEKAEQVRQLQAARQMVVSRLAAVLKARQAEQARAEAEVAARKKAEEDRRNRSALVVVTPADGRTMRVPTWRFDEAWMEEEMAGLEAATVVDILAVGRTLQSGLSAISRGVAERAVSTLGRQSDLQEIMATLDGAIRSNNLDDFMQVAEKVKAATRNIGLLKKLFGGSAAKKPKEEPLNDKSPFELVGDVLARLPTVVANEQKVNDRNISDFTLARDCLRVMDTAFARYGKRFEQVLTDNPDMTPEVADAIRRRVVSLAKSRGVILTLSGSVETYIQASIEAACQIQDLIGVTVPSLDAHYTHLSSLYQFANALKLGQATGSIQLTVDEKFRGLIDFKSDVAPAEQVRQVFARAAQTIAQTIEEPVAQIRDVNDRRRQALDHMIAYDGQGAASPVARMAP